ncbi:MAG TPA: hypothetical protein VLY82_02400 [Nitrososphaerales archaeon]|nr:hypothetical protein [Nitrososphaerales archaeon]
MVDNPVVHIGTNRHPAKDLGGDHGKLEPDKEQAEDKRDVSWNPSRGGTLTHSPPDVRQHLAPELS